MGTKNDPGKFNCYANALPDEPMFVLLARDPLFAEFVKLWAAKRFNAIECGDRPDTDLLMVEEAYKCAINGNHWRRVNIGKWRK